MAYELTTTTRLIMEYLWEFPDGISFREIFDHFTENGPKEWKRQTIYTYLMILTDHGFLRTEGSRRKTRYIPAISHEDYLRYHAREILDDSYNGSFAAFAMALAGGDLITKEDAQILLPVLEQILHATHDVTPPRNNKV